MVTFAELTTLRVGGPAGHLERVSGAAELAEAVRTVDRAEEPLLVLGGGSNLVVADEGFAGTTLQDTANLIEVVDSSSCGGTSVKVSAGTNWDEFVSHAIANEWMGVEALSGIPGTVGAAPIQNIGAYGQEVAETIAAVQALDRLTDRVVRLPLIELHFGYRDSIIKRSLRNPEVGGGRTWGPTGRWVVLEVEFQFRHASLSAPVRYRELADKLGIEIGKRAPASEVREAVLELRTGKGMVLSETDHDTWSAGSFFTNPVLREESREAQNLPADAPRFPIEQHYLRSAISVLGPEVPGQVKTSAAWLIDHAGFSKGYRLSPDAPASLSTKHVLALTNRGEATTSDILELGRTVRDGVNEQYGITLVPEPVLVNCAL